MAQAQAIIVDLGEFRRRRQAAQPAPVVAPNGPAMVMWYPMPLWVMVPCWPLLR